jgi:hypothetical protein
MLRFQSVCEASIDDHALESADLLEEIMRLKQFHLQESECSTATL